MSNRRHLVNKIRKSENRAAVDAARFGAALQGCTCDPNFVVRRMKCGTATSGSITSVQVQHDSWCPLLAKIGSEK